jgi:BRCA1-like protein
MAVRVAITGALSMPRKSAAELIETHTNAKFADSVTYDVNYLVASRFDTNKARKAAKIGVTVISEAELIDFIQKGEFPKSEKPVRPDFHDPFRVDEITWTEEIQPERVCFLEYSDNEGVATQRFVRLCCKGRGSNGHDYLGAFDNERFKTFRTDRVVRLEEL